MPVLRLIRERFEREQPLAGLRIGACLHVTTETANLMRTLKAGGADVHLAASNPLSTQDWTRGRARRRVRHRDLRPPRRGQRDATTTTSAPSRTSTRRSRWTTAATSCRCSTRSAATSCRRSSPGTEETTTGVIRLRAMAADGALTFPVVAVNEAETKHLFDNRYGTGQSTIDGILRATNILIAGPQRRRRRLRLGGQAGSRAGWTATARTSRWSRSTRSERIEALMDGFQVMTVGEAAPLGRPVRDRDRQRQRVPARALRLDEGRRDHGQLRPLRRGAGPRRRCARWPRATSATSAPNVQEFDLGGKKAQPHRRGPAREPRRGRGPPGRGHGHELREPGAVRPSTSRSTTRSSSPRSTSCPRRSTPRSPGSSWRRSGITLDDMTPEQLEYVTSWQHGT